MKAILSNQLPRLQAYQLLVPRGSILLGVGEMPRSPMEDQNYFASWMYDADVEDSEYVTLFRIPNGEAFDDTGLLFVGQLGLTASLFMAAKRDLKE